MSEHPIYLIARGDAWLADESVPGASVAFWSREDAEDYAGAVALRQGMEAGEFRVVEYTFSEARKR